MLPIYLGAYIFLLAVLWGFFFVARHHTCKFKHFSSNIMPVTNMLMFVLLVLSILGAVLILTLDSGTSEVKVNTEKKVTETYY